MLPRLEERVEEDHDVGVSLRVRLGDPGLAALRGRAPVDPAQAVAGDEGPDVGELDPLAAGTRNLVAGERLGLERPQEPAQALPPRIDLERALLLERPLVHEQPEPVLRAEDEVADAVRAPAAAAELEVDLAPLGPPERDQHRVRRLGHDAPREVEQELEPADRVVGAQLDLDADGLALELALVLERERPVDPRRLREREPDDEHGRERRRERDQLGPSQHERSQKPEPGERRVGTELRGRGARHSAASSGSASVLGVGTRSSSSATMSAGRSRCTQSSGRRESRCASAGTATALTSCGTT